MSLFYDRDGTLGNFMNIASLSEVPGNQQASNLVFARHLYPEGYATIVNPCIMARPDMMLHMIAPGFDKAGPPRSASPKPRPSIELRPLVPQKDSGEDVEGQAARPPKRKADEEIKCMPPQADPLTAFMVFCHELEAQQGDGVEITWEEGLPLWDSLGEEQMNSYEEIASKIWGEAMAEYKRKRREGYKVNRALPPPQLRWKPKLKTPDV